MNTTTTNRKRGNPYSHRHAPYKRRRPLPAAAAAAAAKPPSSVVVIGVPPECSVLDLKSRFEMYGPISRTRMDPAGVAYVTFRSADAAQSAVDAAKDSSFPVTLHSVPVQVMWATDPVPLWKGGVGRKEGLSSKLVRAEVPLSRHGRGNRLGSAIVNPRDENNKNGKKSTANGDDDNDEDKLNGAGVVGYSGLQQGSFKGREIVAYDDIL